MIAIKFIKNAQAWPINFVPHVPVEQVNQYGKLDLNKLLYASFSLSEKLQNKVISKETIPTDTIEKVYKLISSASMIIESLT